MVSEYLILTNFSAISSLLRNVSGYVRCSFLPEEEFGVEIAPDYYNINLEQIDFRGETFDIVLSSDVMEHVRNCEKAHVEINRILKTGGTYIFNVPYNEKSEADIVLVDTSADEDVYLCRPHYHGDPLTSGILSYRIFGRSLIGALSDIGFNVTFNRITCPEALIVDGDVFLAGKVVETL